jgi:hypothetical protein
VKFKLHRKLRFQPGKTVDFLPDVPQLAIEHELHIGTGVMLLL